MLKFITGNKNKFKEMQKLLSPIPVEQLEIDLVEIQELDPRKVIEHKLKEAFKHHKGEFIIEDGNLNLEAFNYKFPGTLIKWFLQAMSNLDIVNLTAQAKKPGAKYKITIAYAKENNQIKYFTGAMSGKIVKPKGRGGFGFDPILQPKGSLKTSAELKENRLYSFNPRVIAATKLKNYLLKNQ